MKELGRILREKREELGLDFDKVHRSTKIQEKYISAIEDGNEAVFLAEIYYKSFVKSYSKFLGLNGDDLLAQYEKRKSESSSYENAAGKSNRGTRSSGEGDLKKLFITLFIASVLCAAFLYLNKNISIFTDDNPERISALEKKKIQLEKMQELQNQKERESKERQRLKEISGEMPKKTEDEDKNKEKELKPFPQKPAHTQAESKPVVPAMPAAVSRNVQSSGVNVPAAAADKRQNDKQELEIVAVENVWIKVDGDGREMFQGTIIKGVKKNWKADNEFIVNIGYTPGVNVYFNGTEVDVNKGAVQDVNRLLLRRQR